MLENASSVATSDEPQSAERRHLLKLMAASAALAGAGCSGPPPEKILPYVHDPEYRAPAEPFFYATALSLGGYARGVLVKNVDGRPIKVEGNPHHPASLGGTDIFAQASILDLWDPARSQNIIHDGEPSTYRAVQAALTSTMQSVSKAHGRGLRILTRTVCSPLLASQLDDILKRYPEAQWHQYDPLHEDNALDATRQLFGRPLQALFHFDIAERVVSFDADFLQGGPASVRHARDLVTLRNPERGTMSRVFAVETTPGLIGAIADECIALSPSDIERLITRLASHFEVLPHQLDNDKNIGQHVATFESNIVAELTQHQGRCLLVPGPRLSVTAHRLLHEINIKLGAMDRCLEFIEPAEARAVNHVQSIRALNDAITAGEVKALIIIDGNPVYDAPADSDFAKGLKTIPFSLHLAMYCNETSTACKWHVPKTHELEHWSDLRAFDGTITIVQPLLLPLYNGCSPHRLLSWLLADSPQDPYDMLRQFHQRSNVSANFDSYWKDALRKGMVERSAYTPINVRPSVNTARSNSIFVNQPASAWTLLFSADDSVRDGEYSSNAWLQELPRPLNKLTWDNAALISPSSAASLGVNTGDFIQLATANGELVIPAWIQPGHADRCVTLPLGYGRVNAAGVAAGVGINAYPLRRSDGMWSVLIKSIKRVEGSYLFATTQHHARMEGRDIIRSATLSQFLVTPNVATAKPEQRIPDKSLYEEYPYDSYRWAMTINLNACIGCNACTIACQAENNIPVVGKDQVIRGREMHWIRVDRYYEGDDSSPRTAFQPVPCMHCEHAPCEEVCPVGATMHDSEGINVQVYNRCVGTRFCSNNCPYKVRRFNFLQYSNEKEESLKALQNPDVTVRQRGVMEKCNYCLQRITRARIEADRRGRNIEDGEVVTACQAACPTAAISFGDLKNPKAKLHDSKSSPRNYALLAELNTRPRTTYLARVINPVGESIILRDSKS